ncbi:MAG: mechanosensitive ion channel [Spirochaetes bacterium]|nr:mechanosensitive ion channel [Spirochaetota bacterium]
MQRVMKIAALFLTLIGMLSAALSNDTAQLTATNAPVQQKNTGILSLVPGMSGVVEPVAAPTNSSGEASNTQVVQSNAVPIATTAITGKAREPVNWRELILHIVFALIVTAVLTALLIAMKKLFPALYRQIKSGRDSFIPSIKIQKLELLSSSRITDLLVKAAKGVRIGLTVILFYFYLPLMFSFFPATRGIATVLFGYVLSPLRSVGHGFLAYLPNVFFIGVIGVVTYYVVRLIGWLFAEIGKGTIVIPGFYKDWARTTFLIVRFFIFAVAGIMVFPYLPGAGSPAFQGVGVFLGLLLSLGSASAISNIISGVVLTYTRAFRVGDCVRVAETTGEVTEKSLLVTRVRTFKNVIVTIPNAIVLGSHVINYSTEGIERGLILHTSVTIGYDVPWPKVHALLVEASRGVKDVRTDPPPFVLQTALDDFSVRYELNVYIDAPLRMPGIQSDLHQHIQDSFTNAGVEIMSPHYSAIRDGNHSTIPAEKLPETYTQPPFKISTVPHKE